MMSIHANSTIKHLIIQFISKEGEFLFKIPGTQKQVDMIHQLTTIHFNSVAFDLTNMIQFNTEK